jgi:hypothetical protein
MAPYVRESLVKATPATIWKTCFTPMKWESWDPDVEALEDVSGDCVNGTTFIFIMKEGSMKKIPVSLSDVKEKESVRFSGVVLGGMMKFDGLIEITTAKDDANASNVKYSFDMFGPLGSMVNWLNPAPVTEGVEKGLENIKKLSEGA